MTKLSVVNCVAQQSLEDLMNFLRQNSTRVFTLDGESVTDKASFFDKAAEQLPQEAGLIARDHWDALVDSLRGGLSQLDDVRVAIVWTRVDRILDHGLPVLLEAVDCFRQLAREFARTAPAFSHPKHLYTFLLGEGGNFPPFQASEYVLSPVP